MTTRWSWLVAAKQREGEAAGYLCLGEDEVYILRGDVVLQAIVEVLANHLENYEEAFLRLLELLQHMELLVIFFRWFHRLQSKCTFNVLSPSFSSSSSSSFSLTHSLPPSLPLSFPYRCLVVAYGVIDGLCCVFIFYIHWHLLVEVLHIGINTFPEEEKRMGRQERGEGGEGGGNGNYICRGKGTLTLFMATTLCGNAGAGCT